VQLAGTFRLLGLGPGLADRRQQQGDQDGNDAGDDHQFDQAEPAAAGPASVMLRLKGDHVASRFWCG